MTKACFIIAYDISDKKRLQRLHRVVSEQLLQLQYSVYYGRMSRHAMDSLIKLIQSIIHKSDDDVRIYEVEPLENAIVFGKGDEDIIMMNRNGDRVL